MIIIPISVIVISIISLIISILLIAVFKNKQEKFDNDIKLLYRIREELHVRLAACEAAERDHEARLKKAETLEDYKELFRPYIQTWQPPCYSDDGICTNPQHDCINCPRLYGNTGNSGKYKIRQYWTSDSTSTFVNNFDTSNITVTDGNINKEFITPTINE